MTYELRHPDGRGVISPIPNCGYDQRTLASLRQAGFVLYKDGVPVKSRRRDDIHGRGSDGEAFTK